MLQFSNFRRQVRNVFAGVGEKVRGPKSIRNFGVESLELRDCPAVSFLNFAENSPTDPLPLLGTTPTIIGNSALFDPNGFQSTSNPVSPSDSTVDFLTFTVNADQGTTISKLNFKMSGDTTLTGIPASFAAAGISANAFIRVTQLEGNVASNVTTSLNLLFDPNSGQYSLANNGNIIGKIVNGTAEIDVNALLANNNITGKATSIDVTLNTVLNTNASSNGSAFIQVKQTEVDVTTVEPVGSIGDTVFYDYNGNGVQDPGDNGVDGVTVDLIYAGVDNIFGNSDDQTFQTTTAGGGKYLFSNLPLGAYQVSVDTLSAPLVGYSNTFDPDGGFDSKAFVTLTLANANNLNQDFGYAPATGQIGDTIFNDFNGNGVQDANDTGISGVTVKITNTLTNLSQTLVTDASGNYLFNNLPAGSYTVAVTAGAGTPLASLQQTADPDSTLDNASSVSLVGPNSLVNLLQDFGYAPINGQIGDTIFNDTNANGVQDSGENGIAGVTVTLLYAGKDGDFATTTDNVSTPVVTDANGKYLFSNLIAGNYKVTVTTGAGTPLAGLTQTADPDSTLDSTSTVALAGPSSMSNLDQDFGYVFKSGSIGDTVFSDLNGNGIQDSGEPGIDGVTINLKYAGADGIFDNADDGQYTAVTAGGGKYLFSNLLLGGYQVKVDTITAGNPLIGLTNTADPDGVRDSFSDVTLTTATPNNLLQDFGYAPTNGTIGDTIYNDKDGNGTQGPNDPGIAGVTVTLTYAGIDGIFGTSDDKAGGSQVTDSNGHYLFNNLVAGKYQVVVTTATGPLVGFINTADPDNADNKFDSKSVVALSGPSSMSNLNQDFGYQSATSSATSILSGVVYVDANNNGLIDSNEIGIAGVTLTLQKLGTDNLYSTTATTTTDAGGFYTFQSLADGTYRIVETHPVAYLDGIDTAGTLGGTVSNDVISGISISGNQIGVGYNFGERGLVKVTKRMFLASTGTLTSGTSAMSNLQTLFTTASANAPLVNAYLNPTAARAQGFNASSFTSSLALAGATSMSQKSRTSTGTGSTSGTGITDAQEFLLDIENNEAIVDLAFDDIDLATV